MVLVYQLVSLVLSNTIGPGTIILTKKYGKFRVRISESLELPIKMDEEVPFEVRICYSPYVNYLRSTTFIYSTRSISN